MDWLDLFAVQGTLESSPAPQFESISSSVLRFLYGPTLTAKRDYWINHIFHCMSLCQQSDAPAFEYSELISFRIDWLDLLAVQGTLKSLLQNHSSNASILGHSAFFVVQLSHLNMTTRKTIASTI